MRSERTVTKIRTQLVGLSGQRPMETNFCRLSGSSDVRLFSFMTILAHCFLRTHDPRRTVTPVDVQEIHMHGEYILAHNNASLHAMRCNSDGIFINISRRRHLWHEIEVAALPHVSRRKYLDQRDCAHHVHWSEN